MLSNFGLLGHFECVVNLDAQVPHRAFKLGVAQQQLDRAKILCPSVDQRGFRPSHRICAVAARVETDVCHPTVDDSRVLPC